MKVKLISVTPDAEKIMGYCARVSNPKNQDNPNYAKLLKYCIENKHWSVFEMADMTVEVETSVAISMQKLRHSSAKFQQFSQRYSEVTNGYELVEARSQDWKNRQNSNDDMSDEVKQWFLDVQKEVNDLAYKRYQEALAKGIAKEQARFLLTVATKTTMYVKNNVRNWIHYLQVRTDPSTQKEHRDVALAIQAVFCEQFPTVAQALGWKQ
jgi:thymidylate synthase (FAD)